MVSHTSEKAPFRLRSESHGKGNCPTRSGCCRDFHTSERTSRDASQAHRSTLIECDCLRQSIVLAPHVVPEDAGILTFMDSVHLNQSTYPASPRWVPGTPSIALTNTKPASAYAPLRPSASAAASGASCSPCSYPAGGLGGSFCRTRSVTSSLCRASFSPSPTRSCFWLVKSLRLSALFVAPKGGIEPPTTGVTIRGSTN